MMSCPNCSTWKWSETPPRRSVVGTKGPPSGAIGPGRNPYPVIESTVREEIKMTEDMNWPPKYVVITPVRDEEAHLEATIRSVINQTIRPSEWIIVDDGSTDKTRDIIGKYAEQHQWIRGVYRINRGFRKSGGGVVEAFNDGFHELTCRDWAFVVKLDGDLSFEPDYFERILNRFRDEPTLGIAGGTLHCVSNGHKIERNPHFHVRGATKVYRRKCWEAIGGLWPAAGWDTVDEVSASMRGWITLSIPDIHALHHRHLGGADGMWYDSVKHGRIWYTVGYHPLFVLASCLYRALQKPYLVRSIGGLYGFLQAYLNRVPRVNDCALIKFMRNEQMKRLMGQATIWK